MVESVVFPKYPVTLFSSAFGRVTLLNMFLCLEPRRLAIYPSEDATVPHIVISVDEAPFKVHFLGTVEEDSKIPENFWDWQEVEFETGPAIMGIATKYKFLLSKEACEELQRWVPTITKDFLRKELHSLGIGLIIVGILHLVFSQFLSPVWGIFLIVLGMGDLLINHPAMLILGALSLIGVGVANTLAGFAAAVSVGSSFGRYLPMFGILQIIWGIQDLFKVVKHFFNVK